MTQALSEAVLSAVDKDRPHDKTAFVAELVPHDRKLVEFAIELANTAGALAEVASILSAHKVNILTGFHDAVEWSFFADVTEIESSIDDVVKEISSLASVSKVSQGREQTAGFIVDSLHRQLTWGPFRSIVIRADVMSSLLNRIKGIFGPEGTAGKTMVFCMGEAAGRAAYKGVASTLGAEVLRSRIEDEMLLYQAQGWGEVKTVSVDLDRTTARALISSSFECAHESSSGWTCDFIRGHLTGLLSETFGKRVNVTETLCAAHGHNMCQFDVSEAKQ